MTNKNQINGVLLLDKPLGISSNAALQKVKRLYNAAKAGHTGTLDPLATGLLPICLGEATKFSSYLLDADKEYIATIKLGTTTTTYDKEGEVVNVCEVGVTQSMIADVVHRFLGTITQTPPIYSALKVAGKPLYTYARTGLDVAIKSRNITIYELEILEFIDNETFKLRVLCSKGTYIRSLAHDIGQNLACGAHLYALVRTKTSGFTLNHGYSLAELSGYDFEELMSKLLPVDGGILHLPKFELDDAQYNYIKYGHSFVAKDSIIEGQRYRLYYGNRFLGVAVGCDQCVLKPQRLLNTAM